MPRVDVGPSTAKASVRRSTAWEAGIRITVDAEEGRSADLEQDRVQVVLGVRLQRRRQ